MIKITHTIMYEDHTHHSSIQFSTWILLAAASLVLMELQSPIWVQMAAESYNQTKHIRVAHIASTNHISPQGGDVGRRSI